MDCRHFEVREAAAALDRHKIAWIVSEPDMCGDDYLALLRRAQGAEDHPIFRLDLTAFKGLSDELDGLQNIVVDGDIPGIGAQLSTIGNSYILLDEVSFGSNEAEAKTIAKNLHELAQIFLDYSGDLKVIIRSPVPFTVPGLSPVILRPLDEPESKTYIELHPRGKLAQTEDIQSGAIHLYTAGWPGRIDKLLKGLEINTFESIAHGSSDQSIETNSNLPDSQKQTIERLRSNQPRTYNLLEALTLFKFGESVDTVKYFGSHQRIRPEMADFLIEAGLAEAAETYELGLKRGEQEKFILIRPHVQRFLHREIGHERLKKLTEDAASVYFGKDWKIRSYKIQGAARNSDNRIHSIVEKNASHILVRILSDAIDSEDSYPNPNEIINRINMLHHYVLRLMNKNKYLHVSRLCRATLPILKDFSSNNLVQDIRLQYARSLRMLSEHEDSIEQCKTLAKQDIPVKTLALLYINMAYSHESLGEVHLTKEYAKKVIALKLKSESTFHAQSILLGLSEDPDKLTKLEGLAKKARSKGFNASSNNIMMDIISEITDPLKRMNEYRELADRAREDNNQYNMIKATINWIELAVELGQQVNKKDFDSLLTAYSYSCGQRQRHMFTQSHAVLWELLEQLGQTETLLQLFRHSSTLQRLTNQNKTEQEYLERLFRLINETSFEQVVQNSDRSLLRYFATRAHSRNLLNSSQFKALKHLI